MNFFWTIGEKYNPFYDGQMADGELWVWRIYEFQNTLRECPALEFLPKLDEEAIEMQKNITDVVNDIRRKEKVRMQQEEKIGGQKDKEYTRGRGFSVLLLYLNSIMLFDNEVVGALGDLLECCQRLCQESTTETESAKRKEDMDEEEEPDSMAVLVDILISLLTKPSAHLKDLVMRVFRMFNSQLTAPALRTLIDVVSGKRDAALFGVEEEEVSDLVYM